MSYDAANPPFLLANPSGAKPQLWGYSSTVDGSTVAIGSGYFANGKDLGMRVDDFIMGTLGSSNALYFGKVTAVSSTGATIATGTLTSTT